MPYILIVVMYLMVEGGGKGGDKKRCHIFWGNEFVFSCAFTTAKYLTQSIFEYLRQVLYLVRSTR